MKIIWNKEFDTGIKKIDEQHKKIVTIINNLNDEILINKNSEAINEMLIDLKIYTISHLDYEERLFKKHNYEGVGFEEHIKKHNDFKKAIGDFFSEGVIVKSEFAYKISMFLKDWLFNHILDTDMKFAEFIKLKELEASKQT